MERLKGKPNDENIIVDQRGLNRAVKKAKQEALSRRELDSLRIKDIELTRSFLFGEISLSAFRKKTEYARSVPGTMFFDSLEDFQTTLSLLLPKDVAVKILEHEEKHFKTAKEFGFGSKLGILFSQDGKTAHFRSAFTYVEIPAGFNEEDARNALRKVILAPADNMSSKDKEMVKTV